MTINRRNFLQASAAVAACGALGSSIPTFAAEKTNKKIPIGIQLYCVRGEFAKDPAGSLKKLAELGYVGVEPFGYGGGDKVQGIDPKELRKMMDDAGVKCCGIHMSPAALSDANFAKAVVVNKVLGNKFLVVAANQAGMKSPEAIKAYAELLSKKSEEAKKLDMRIGYHAHPFDFVKFDGKPAWELLFEQTDPSVIMQLDVGNCMGGGGDPIAMLKKFPGRCTSLHVKEHPGGKFGANGIDWETIFDLCEKKHATEWYVVEQGGPGYTIVEQTIDAMKAMGR